MSAVDPSRGEMFTGMLRCHPHRVRLAKVRRVDTILGIARAEMDKLNHLSVDPQHWPAASFSPRLDQTTPLPNLCQFLIAGDLLPLRYRRIFCCLTIDVCLGEYQRGSHRRESIVEAVKILACIVDL